MCLLLNSLFPLQARWLKCLSVNTVKYWDRKEPGLGGKEVGKSDIGVCPPKVLHLAVLSSVNPFISPRSPNLKVTGDI